MSNTVKYDVIIVGGGPSGMACAIELGRCKPSLSVLIIEKNPEPGRKLAATGSGRCNISNVNAAGYIECMEFLRRVGIACRVYDNGLVYPYSESAADVVDVLKYRLEECGVDIAAGESVAQTDMRDGKYDVRTDKSHYEAEYLVLATGGKAGPNFGSIGDGYRMAAAFGHSIVTTVPVLTSIECGAQGCEKLGGIRARGRVTLLRAGIKIFEEDGEIQFTRQGLSGICVFNMTRHMRYAKNEGEDLSVFTVVLDLMAGGDAAGYIEDRRREALAAGSDETLSTVLRALLKPALAAHVLEASGVDVSEKIAFVDDETIRAISETVHGLEFKPTGISGWKSAQCTSGGVSLEEIDSESCESRLSEKLYIIGELADYDGPCGGYNLTNAIVTGIKAARGIK